MIRIGSLFSGYGGLDLAVQASLAGEIVWHADNDPECGRILRHHYPHVPNHGDVSRIDFCHVEPVDVLTAGYPCQPFSAAGLRRGSNDERNLWPHVVRAIRDLGPRLVILENVRGHLSLGFADVLSDLASLGWSAQWGLVRASDAGAPHRRTRLFAVAYPKRQRWDGRGTTAPTEIPQSRGAHAAGPASATQWGRYEAAIRRWEHLTGRPAPAPTEAGRDGVERLSPRLAEWMMGLPDGWVTGRLNDHDLFGQGYKISRQNALRILGNGVVPQAATLALDVLFKGATDDLTESLATV